MAPTPARHPASLPPPRRPSRPSANASADRGAQRETAARRGPPRRDLARRVSRSPLCLLPRNRNPRPARSECHDQENAKPRRPRVLPDRCTEQPRERQHPQDQLDYKRQVTRPVPDAVEVIGEQQDKEAIHIATMNRSHSTPPTRDACGRTLAAISLKGSPSGARCSTSRPRGPRRAAGAPHTRVRRAPSQDAPFRNRDPRPPVGHRRNRGSRRGPYRCLRPRRCQTASLPAKSRSGAAVDR
jgi:hypothetical protein